MFLTGGFNAHSQVWWLDSDTTDEVTDIDEKIKKLKKKSIMNTFLVFFLPHKTLKQMYKSLIRPHLD